ncbi:MAG TPA: integration host factor, actinobacterial type, partial [Coriobacteriia bacterium]|nr:integration host factor, actinobacterial type [Coriobacteriia bacterium]
ASPSSPGMPERSAQQRREALAHANRVRTQRAALKADLRQGKCSLAALIAAPPPYLATAKVVELLVALPGHGPAKAVRLLECCHISERKTVAGLSERQRHQLVEALEK